MRSEKRKTTENQESSKNTECGPLRKLCQIEESEDERKRNATVK